MTDIAVIVRGLVTNLLVVIPTILAAAAVTLSLNPTIASLDVPALGFLSLFSGHFALTCTLLVAGFASFSGWAIWRSWMGAQLNELTGPFIYFGRVMLVAVALLAFCELQPFVISKLYGALSKSEALDTGMRNWITGAIQFLTAAAAAISVFHKQIGELVQADAGKAGFTTLVKRAVRYVAISIAALALPLLLWMTYLLVVMWGYRSSLDISWVWHLAYRIGLALNHPYSSVPVIYAAIAVCGFVLWFFSAPMQIRCIGCTATG